MLSNYFLSSTPIRSLIRAGASSGTRSFSSILSRPAAEATSQTGARTSQAIRQQFEVLHEQRQQQQRRGMAKLQVIGRLTAPPETAVTNFGKDYVKYVVAKGHGIGDDKRTSFFRVLAFEEGDRKQRLLDLPKGTMVFVEASAKMSSYVDNDGNNRTALNLSQRSIHILQKPYSENEDRKA